MGVMIEDPLRLPASRADRSDVFYSHLTSCGAFDALANWLLPGRSLPRWSSITNHDDRAAVVCAITALCVAADEYSAVGDVEDGWIILPPGSFIQPWAEAVLGPMDDYYRSDASLIPAA